LKVLQRHAAKGYAAVSIFPLSKEHIPAGLRLPGGIPPHEWDHFHDLILIDEIARIGYLGVLVTPCFLVWDFIPFREWELNYT
jgi:hypothetical protein